MHSSSLSNFIIAWDDFPLRKFSSCCSQFLGWILSKVEYPAKNSRISDRSYGMTYALGFCNSFTSCMSMLVLALSCYFTVLKTLGAVVFGVLTPTFACNVIWSYAKVSVGLLCFCLLIWIYFLESPRASILFWAPTKDGAISSPTLTCFLLS